MCPAPIVGANKGQDMIAQFFITPPRAMRQTLALQGAKPNLDLVQPRGMFRQEMPHHAFGMVEHQGQGWWGGARCQVITDQMQHAIFLHRQDAIQIVQKIDQVHRTMLMVTASVDVPRANLERGQQVEPAMPRIFKFAPRDLPHERGQDQLAFYDLDARFLIEAQQGAILRRMMIRTANGTRESEKIGMADSWQSPPLPRSEIQCLPHPLDRTGRNRSRQLPMTEGVCYIA